jgi:hypothetical protein
LEQIQSDFQCFENDDVNADLALRISQGVWHMCDWVFKEHGNRLGFQKLGDFQASILKRCPEIVYLRDICIETKHAEITRTRPTISSAVYHGGAFSSDFSRDFDISRLELTLVDGTKLWFIDIAKIAVDFWSGYFKTLSP